MKEALYRLVAWIAVVHDKFNGLNDAYEYNFTDKQMHFLIIGLLGMAMTFLLVPIVKLLVQKKMVLTLTWFYVITVLIVITFAIEIGQGFTHTGAMDFADIVAGIYGFLVMFALYAVVRGLIILIHKLIHRKEKLLFIISVETCRVLNSKEKFRIRYFFYGKLSSQVQCL